MSDARTPIIDAHCHLGQDREKQASLSELLLTMDEAGVDRAVVCPVDREITIFNREGNERIPAAVNVHPDRLIGFAVANPWYGEAAVQELRRALDSGLKGVKLHPRLQGFLLNDELVYPLLEVAQERGVPVYFHTGTATTALPFQLGDLAGQFPEITFIMGHMGHSDYWYDALPVARHWPNIYFETSHMMPSVIDMFIAEMGYDRLLFGSNFPVSNMRLELEKVRMLQLDEEGRRQTLGGNLLRLLAGGGNT